MALSSKASYIPTINDFLAHWALVDAFLPPASPFILPTQPGVIPPGFNRSGLLALRDVLEGQLDAVQDKLNDLQINSGAIALKKAQLHKRLSLFLEVVDGFYATTPFHAARPDVPGLGAGVERFLDPMRDAKSLWTKLNAAPAPGGLTLPIVLNEGTSAAPLPVTVAQFATSITELKALYEDRSECEQALILARGQRDQTMAGVRAVLSSYRAAVLFRIAGNVALIDAIPRLSPEPGHTPEPVTVSASQPTPGTALVTHGASSDPDFKELQLRGVAGNDGDAEDAIVLETHDSPDAGTFTTQHGLASPGGAVTLWVYVVTNDGNERASERMVVERPV